MFSKSELDRIRTAKNGPVKDLLYDFLGCEYVVSYRLYFDDSGSHEQAKFQVLAGCMMTIDEWIDLLEEWHACMKELDIPYFHAVDLWAGNPKGKLISAEYRLWMFRELGKVIFKRNYAVLWGVVLKDDFEEVTKEFPHIDLTMFELLVLGAIGKSGDIRDYLGGNGKLGVVLEAGGPEIRQSAIQRIRAHEAKVNHFDIPWQTKSKKDSPELQVADFFAWHYHRYMMDHYDEVTMKASGGNIPPPPLFDDLKTTVNPERYWGRIFDKDWLRKQFKELSDL